MSNDLQDFLSKLSPSMSAKEREFLRLGLSIWQGREDLQEAFDIETIAGCFGLWNWLIWHGLEPKMNAQAEALENCLPDLPPADLAGRVFGEENSVQEFLRSGLVDWRRFQNEVAAVMDISNLKGAAVLDFGGGCGRIARHSLPFAGQINLSLCDVDPDAVKWVSESMAWLDAKVSKHSPPLPYQDEAFDLIYAYSVFTHLPAPLAQDWIVELRRVLKPGGILVLTAQGMHVVNKILSGGVAFPFPKPKVLKQHLDEFEEQGTLFFPYEKIAAKTQSNSDFFETWDLQSYGNFYVTADYVAKVWGDGMPLIRSTLGADDWQDFFVFRK